MVKVKITSIKANGESKAFEIENSDPEVIAETFEALGLDVDKLSRNGEDFDGELEDGDVVVETKTAKGA
jgi:hypothetical protein